MACDPGETVFRELAEETGLKRGRATELLKVPDEHGYSQTITFSAAAWDGDESTLPVTEDIKIQFFAPEHLTALPMLPFIRDGIHRHLATRPT